MTSDSTKTPSKSHSGWESQIDSPLSVMDVEVEYTRPAPLAPPPPSKARLLWKRSWPWLCFVACSVLSYFLISHFVLTTVVVQGRSMSPTLVDGDRYLLQRWQLLFRAPQRGDLVVIRDSFRKDYMVKRVVGLPGESVQFRDGAVWVNSSRLAEPYLVAGMRTHILEGVEPLIMVGRNRYFVMGDNRDVSEDSRSYGPINGDQILGFIPQ